MLSDRQEQVLRRVVQEYLQDGQPVGSKALAESFEWGPSTIRHELASLEEAGLLEQPHISAGRVPTEAGYRYFVDRLLPAEADTPPLRLSLTRSELEEAMRVTTETISKVTNLLAVVTAPSISTATVRRVEVLTLHAEVLMVVVITSTGGVSKRLFNFPSPIDPGLADWAGSYLNERLVGVGLGARRLTQRLLDPSLSRSESEFLETLLPAFTELTESPEDAVYIGGASRLLAHGRSGHLVELNTLMEMLERRAAMLGLLRAAFGEPGVSVRIGAENGQPALRSLVVVAAGYGLPQRGLGAVSVIGPLRMDYPLVMSVVRDAAAQLSRFVYEVYEQR
ncbi:MAG: heat-inducible transcriptional repressor HrcA [Solirubrobacteraceae bacterium]